MRWSDVKNVLMGLVVFLILGVLLYVVCMQNSWHRQEATTWAESRGYKVVRIERVGLFGASNDGPFWRREDDDLMRAVLADSDHQEKVSFFRWGSWWGMEQAWKD